MENTTTDPAKAAPAPDLVCWKIWGGNGQTETPVSIPGLRGALYSRPCGGGRGGDLYYLSACGSGALARVCVADVTGHGESVATFSGWLEEVFSRHIHRASPAAILEEVNRRATSRGLDVMSTAVCLSYNSLNGRLAFCNAGHPPVRICRAGQDGWVPLAFEAEGGLSNMPLAVHDATRYTIGRTQLQPGDRLLIHTDGVTEVHDAAGRQLGETLWEAGHAPAGRAGLAEVIAAFREAVTVHAGGKAEEDDVTLLVLEALPYQRSNRYSLFLRNNLKRLAQRLWGA